MKFRNISERKHPKTQNEGENSNWAHLGPPRIFWKWGCLRWKQPCSPGRAGRQPPPLFSYKKWKGGWVKGSFTFMLCLSDENSEEKWKKEENPSRGASVTLPRRFYERFREGSSLFFGLQPISSQHRIFQFILCTLSGPFLFCMLSFSFRLLFVPPFFPFLISFNRSFKSLSRLINDKIIKISFKK